MRFNIRGVVGLMLSAVFLIGLLVVFVSAQSIDTGSFQPIVDLFNNLVEMLKPFLILLLGSPDAIDSGVYLKKIFVALVVFLVVFLVGKKIPMFSESEHVWALVVLALAMAVGGVRWMATEFVETVFAPTKAFSAIFFTLLPFAGWFYLVKGVRSGFLRKLLWVLLSAGLFVFWLFVARFGKLGGVASFFSYLYLITAILALAMALADSALQKVFAKTRLGKILSSHNSTLELKLYEKYSQINGFLKDGTINASNKREFLSLVNVFITRANSGGYRNVRSLLEGLYNRINAIE